MAVLALAVALLNVPTAASAAPLAPTAPSQVLVASGDGWSVYVEAASVRAVTVSKVQVAGSVTPMTVVNCGTATCSVYLSRSQTQWANYNINALGGGVGGLAAACGIISVLTGPAAGVVAAACGVEMLALGGFLLNAITHAAGDNGCLRIRYGALPTAFYDDHSGYCHDN